jgi:hypothetical protein
MRDAIEFEKLFHSRVAAWSKKVAKRIGEFKKTYPEITQDWMDGYESGRFVILYVRIVEASNQDNPRPGRI